MFDMHYDLLTKIYMCYKDNDFTFIENCVKNYNFDNVRGLIANLCFMSIEEMQAEYHKDYYNPNVSVIEMFKICRALLYKYIPSNIKVLTSIEGCDFLDSEEDLVVLKELGLNSILPVWNNKNKFGSGNRSDDGLTEMGKRLIRKAIELGINIDLSHANEKTFFDCIDIIKEYRKNGIYPIVYASHSNVRQLSNLGRNLTDEQIIALKSVDGLIGLMSNCNYVLNGSLSEKIKLIGTSDYNGYNDTLKKMYINHLLYIKNLLGNIDNIAVSTDDMSFCTYDDDYKYTSIFDYSNINNEIRYYLHKYFNQEEVEKIMYFNVEKKLFNQQDKEKNYE